MEKRMNDDRRVRLPRVMGPVDRWQGKCIPIDDYGRLEPDSLSEGKQNILDWIHDYYQEYIVDETLVNNRDEPILVLVCEYPNFEGYESTAFNLEVLDQKREEEGNDAVEDYFRIPDPAHWEAGKGMHLEDGVDRDDS
jgi:hypothetical protein